MRDLDLGFEAGQEVTRVGMTLMGIGLMIVAFLELQVLFLMGLEMLLMLHQLLLVLVLG